jgi:hypothetical protein
MILRIAQLENLTQRGAFMAKGRANSRAGNGQESVSSYFRKVFRENPKLLKSRSNDQLLQRWLNDHGETEVPKRVKQIMANVKSLMRKARRKRGRRTEEEQALAGPGGAAPARKPGRGLEHLEEQIDDCLSAAKVLDREGLQPVIRLLRQARNAVVWRLGQ